MTVQQQITLVRRIQTDIYKQAGQAKSESVKTEIAEQATALNYVLDSLVQLANLRATLKAVLAEEETEVVPIKKVG